MALLERWTILGWTLPARDSYENIAAFCDTLTAALATTNSDQVVLQTADKQRQIALCAYENHVVCTGWQIEVAGRRLVFGIRAEEGSRKQFHIKYLFLFALQDEYTCMWLTGITFGTPECTVTHFRPGKLRSLGCFALSKNFDPQNGV